MLTIDGVVVPHDVLAQADEIDDPKARDAFVMDHVRAQGGTPLTKEEAAAALPAPIIAQRAKLTERAKARKAERERVAQRNKELAEKNAPAKSPARAIAKVAPTQVAPKSDSAKGSE